MRRGLAARTGVIAAAAALWCGQAAGQSIGHYLQGTTGLNSGTMAPPEAYVTYLPYIEFIDSLKDRNGRTLTKANLTIAIHNLIVNVNVKTDFLGGVFYGARVVVPLVKQRLVADLLPSGSFSNVGVSDVLVQPLILGWNKPRADVLLSYGFCAPTGNFDASKLANVGLGFWEHLFQAGATVHLDKAKTWNASALTTWEVNQTIEHKEIRPGPMFTAEYGLGKTFWKGRVIAGGSGYFYRQLSPDSGPGVPPIVGGVVSQAFAAGPEAQLTLPVKVPVFVSLLVRYQPMFDVKARPSGQVLTIGVTLMKLFLPH